MAMTGASFQGDNSGSVLILTALLATIAMGFMGMALDYTSATALQSRLQAAADAAVLSAISTDSNDKGVVESAARETFLAMLSGGDAAALDTVSAVFQPTPSRSLKIEFRAKSVNTLSSLVGYDLFPANGKASAAISAPTVLRLHFLLDSSGSMGLAASDAGQMAMRAATSWSENGRGCEFACHIPHVESYPSTLEVARSLGVELRFDIARRGIDRMIAIAEQHRSGAQIIEYEFSRFDAAFKQVLSATQNVTPFVNGMHSQELGTDQTREQIATSYDTSFPAAAQFYDATSVPDAEEIIVLITDGLQADGGAIQSAITPAQCNMLKQNGRKLAVFHLPYDKPTDHPAWQDWVQPHIPDINKNIRNCASGNLFVESYDADDIIPGFERLINFILKRPQIRLTS